jgi:hypothetical protein
VKPMNMLVYLPEAAACLPKDHKVPLLVYVDQADADVSLSATSLLPSDTIQFDQFYDVYGPFLQLYWIAGLTTKGDRIFQIQASKPGFVTCCQTLTIPRDPPGDGFGIAPYITSPTLGGTVPQNFSAFGTVVTGESPCTAWLVDANNNTYPGMAIPGQPPNNWAFGFQNIPVGSYKLYAQASTGDQRNEPITVTQQGI